MPDRRALALGAFVPGGGAHGAAWRLPEIDLAASASFATYQRIARKLEQGCFDTLFMNDSVGISDLTPTALERNTQVMRWDPLTLLPALAVVTNHIGLTATASTTYNEPYTLARRFASLGIPGKTTPPSATNPPGSGWTPKNFTC